MATASCIYMPQNADRLTLIQWLSPAFPVGSYAYSQGLEQAITDGHVTEPGSLADWITATLTHGSACIDAILLAHARTADDLADLAWAYATSAERSVEMREQGAAFGQLIATLTGQPQPALPYALAVGHASRMLDLPTTEIVGLYLHALAARLVSAAVRFVPLGAADGQKVLASLAPLITRPAADYASKPLSALSGATFGADLAAIADLNRQFPDLDLILIESGGDNLAATFSPELADLSIYVIDTAAGQDIPRKRGPGVTRSDLLIVNKTDLAPYVGVDLTLLEEDSKRTRSPRPYVMARRCQNHGVAEVVAWLEREGGLTLRPKT